MPSKEQVPPQAPGVVRRMREQRDRAMYKLWKEHGLSFRQLEEVFSGCGMRRWRWGYGGIKNALLLLQPLVDHCDRSGRRSGERPGLLRSTGPSVLRRAKMLSWQGELWRREGHDRTVQYLGRGVPGGAYCGSHFLP
jgi:hypothetical protein